MIHLTLLLALLVAAQSGVVRAPGTPARDVGFTRMVALRGRVVADTEARTPLRRVRIIVTSGSSSAGPVFTDDLGRFEARVPDAADYTLVASKSGFAPSTLPRPRPSSGAIEIRLAPAAVLNGRVFHASGQPLTARNVYLRRMDALTGAVVTRQSLTDDLGEYRFGNLPAGTYTVGLEQSRAASAVLVMDASTGGVSQPIRRLEPPPSAQSSTDVVVELRAGEEKFVAQTAPEPVSSTFFFAPGTNIQGDAVTLQGDVVIRPADFLPPGNVTRSNARPPSGVVTGTVLDEFGEPAEGVFVDLWRIRRDAGRLVLGSGVTRRQTDDRGRYRVWDVQPGTYYVAVIGERAINADVEPAPLFYPGRLAIAEAVPVQVDAGQDLSGIDMVIGGSSGARVHGVALDAAGQPMVGSVMISVMISSELVAIPSRHVTIGEGGRFELLNVTPGDYLLQAIGKGSADREFGMQAVAVAGSEVGPVVISTSPGSTVKGTVTMEGTAPSEPPNNKIGLGLVPAAPEYVPAVTAYTGGFINKDWTFELAGITGSTRFILEGAPANWWLKSVAIDFSNAADDPVMFGTRRQSRTDVNVVISTNGASIEGRVRLPRGANDARFHGVVVFPVDSERWYYRSRYLKQANVGGDGAFVVSGLPPGEYWAVAVDQTLRESAPPNDPGDPDFLKSLEPFARRVRLSEGQRLTIELTPASIPR